MGSQPTGMVFKPVSSNFRSQKQLIDFFNAFSENLFQDKARGAANGRIYYSEIVAKVPSDPNMNSQRLHIMLNPGTKVHEWVDFEAERLAAVISGIIQEPTFQVRKGKDDMKKAQAGDIALLFRRKTHIPTYVKALRSYGISCAVQTDSSLFSEPEISLITDFLDWLANPELRDSVVRILRSPIVALSDKTLRYLSSERFILQLALDHWMPDLGLPESDKVRLVNLLRFREDLRWDRERSKADLIQRIIDHGCIKTPYC